MDLDSNFPPGGPSDVDSTAATHSETPDNAFGALTALQRHAIDVLADVAESDSSRPPRFTPGMPFINRSTASSFRSALRRMSVKEIPMMKRAGSNIVNMNRIRAIEVASSVAAKVPQELHTLVIDLAIGVGKAEFGVYENLLKNVLAAGGLPELRDAFDSIRDLNEFKEAGLIADVAVQFAQEGISPASAWDISLQFDTPEEIEMFYRVASAMGRQHLPNFVEYAGKGFHPYGPSRALNYLQKSLGVEQTEANKEGFINPFPQGMDDSRKPHPTDVLVAGKVTGELPRWAVGREVAAPVTAVQSDAGARPVEPEISARSRNVWIDGTVRDVLLEWRKSITSGVARIQRRFADAGRSHRGVGRTIRRVAHMVPAAVALLGALASSNSGQVVAQSSTPSTPHPNSSSQEVQRNPLVADLGIRKGKEISSSGSPRAKLETVVSGLVAKKMAGELGVAAKNVAGVKRAIERGDFKAASERIESLGSLEPGDASAVAYSLGKLQGAFGQGGREDAHKSVWAAGLVGDEFKEVVKNYADRTFDRETGPKDWESAKKSLEKLGDFGL